MIMIELFSIWLIYCIILWVDDNTRRYGQSCGEFKVIKGRERERGPTKKVL